MNKKTSPSGFFETAFVVTVVEMPFRLGHSELCACFDKAGDGWRDAHLAGLVVLLGEHVVQERNNFFLLCWDKSKLN